VPYQMTSIGVTLDDVRAESCPNATADSAKAEIGRLIQAQALGPTL
jgi:hypothetical protein